MHDDANNDTLPRGFRSWWYPGRATVPPSRVSRVVTLAVAGVLALAWIVVVSVALSRDLSPSDDIGLGGLLIGPVMVFGLLVAVLAVWGFSMWNARLRPVLAWVEIALIGAVVVWLLHALAAFTLLPHLAQQWAIGVDTFAVAGVVFALLVAIGRALGEPGSRSRAAGIVGAGVLATVGTTAVILLVFEGGFESYAPPAHLVAPASRAVEGYPLGFDALGAVPEGEGIVAASSGTSPDTMHGAHAGEVRSATDGRKAWLAAYLVANEGRLEVVLRSSDEQLLGGLGDVTVEGRGCQEQENAQLLGDGEYRETFAVRSAGDAGDGGVYEVRHLLRLPADALVPAHRLRLRSEAVVCMELLNPGHVLPFVEGGVGFERDCVRPLNPSDAERRELSVSSFPEGDCRRRARRLLDVSHLAMAGGGEHEEYVRHIARCLRGRGRPVGRAIVRDDYSMLPIGRAMAQGGPQQCDDWQQEVHWYSGPMGYGHMESTAPASARLREPG